MTTGASGFPPMPPPPGASYPTPERPRGWWSRNWLWFVPVLVGSLLLFSCLCCGGLAWIGFRTMRQTQVYQVSLQRVQQDPRVQAALGTPIEPGFSVAVNESYMNGVQRAHTDYAIKGPRGGATVHADMTNGMLSHVEVELDAGGPGPRTITVVP